MIAEDTEDEMAETNRNTMVVAKVPHDLKLVCVSLPALISSVLMTIPLVYTCCLVQEALPVYSCIGYDDAMPKLGGQLNALIASIMCESNKRKSFALTWHDKVWQHAIEL